MWYFRQYSPLDAVTIFSTLCGVTFSKVLGLGDFCTSIFDSLLYRSNMTSFCDLLIMWSKVWMQASSLAWYKQPGLSWTSSGWFILKCYWCFKLKLQVKDQNVHQCNNTMSEILLVHPYFGCIPNHSEHCIKTL